MEIARLNQKIREVKCEMASVRVKLRRRHKRMNVLNDEITMFHGILNNMDRDLEKYEIDREQLRGENHGDE